MNIFTFDDNKLSVNKEEILLVKEFASLWEPLRNRTEKDKGGYNRTRALAEFTYIYLVFDWDSPYKNYPEQEKHLNALEDSGLTDKQFNDDKFKAAALKYQDMQETAQVKLLKGAYKACNELTLFYLNADLQERDETGKHILDHKKLMDSVAKLGDMVSGLEKLEEVVRKQKEANAPKIRGDIEPGMFD